MKTYVVLRVYKKDSRDPPLVFYEFDGYIPIIGDGVLFTEELETVKHSNNSTEIIKSRVILGKVTEVYHKINYSTEKEYYQLIEMYVE